MRYNNNGKIAKIKICAVPVSEENYQNAKKQIKDIESCADEYIYNFISAATFPFRKTVVVKKSYTCVEFVLSMVRKYSDIPELKEEKFLSIEDFCEMLDSYKVYEGSIEKFFAGADWEGDSFAEEKGTLFRWRPRLKITLFFSAALLRMKNKKSQAAFCSLAFVFLIIFFIAYFRKVACGNNTGGQGNYRNTKKGRNHSNYSSNG